jgi:peptide/nickel transport system permease protein
MASMQQVLDSDIFYSFKRSPLVIIAAVIAAICIFAALFAPWVAPHNPFDLKTLNLLDAFTPPAWNANGKAGYFLGTDDQGRDVFSTIIFGSRMSLLVGLIATLLAMTFGVTMGLISGYAGGKIDAFIMRVADIQLSFPSILIALLVDGLFRVALPKELHDQLAVYVLILAIAASGWVRYAELFEARLSSSETRSTSGGARHRPPSDRDHVPARASQRARPRARPRDAAHRRGDHHRVHPLLPRRGRAADAALARDPHPHRQRLPLLGEWWITVFPGAALVILVLAINVLGDWLRDALNPKLR